jgi:hypothetical protein
MRPRHHDHRPKPFRRYIYEERNSVAKETRSLPNSCDPLRLAACNPARHDGRQFWRAQCTPRLPVRTHDGKHLPRGSARCERAKMPNDQGYALIATLLSRSQDTEMMGRLALLRGDASPLGAAHAGLGEAARKRKKMIWHRCILIYLPAWEAARSCRIRPTI